MSTQTQPRTPDGRYTYGRGGAPLGGLEEESKPDSKRLLTEDDLFDEVSRMLPRRSAMLSHADREEWLSTSCLEILTQMRNGRPVTVSYAQKIVSSYREDGLNGEDWQAVKALGRKVAEVEVATGRHLSGAKKAALFETIRAQWSDPRHKPSADLLRRLELHRAGSVYTEDGTMLEGTIVDSDAVTDHYVATPGGAYERAMGYAMGRGTHEETDDEGRVVTVENSPRMAEARREVWDGLAEVTGAPTVARASLDKNQASWCRTTIRDYPGGAAMAAERWRKAEGDQDAGVVALFAPYGDIDDHQRDMVAEIYHRHPHVADRLYTAALSAAAQ